MCQVGIASVRLTHAISFGLQIVARDLQFLHELSISATDVAPAARESSVDDMAASAGLLPRTSARMPPSSNSMVVSEDFDFATSIGFPISQSAS